MWAATLAQPDTAFVSNDNKNNNDRVSCSDRHESKGHYQVPSSAGTTIIRVSGNNSAAT